MKRTAVIGVSGSGKTTLALDLARRLNVRCIHSEWFAWEANWKTVAPDILRERIEAATEKGCWVFDGNRFVLRNLIWQRADTIVWLDYSLPTVLTRICIRNVRRVVTREPLWNGNREHWRRALGGVRDSFCNVYRSRRQYPRLLAEFTHLQIVHLRSPRQAQDWLRQLNLETRSN